MIGGVLKTISSNAGSSGLDFGGCFFGFGLGLGGSVAVFGFGLAAEPFSQFLSAFGIEFKNSRNDFLILSYRTFCSAHVPDM